MQHATSYQHCSPPDDPHEPYLDEAARLLAEAPEAVQRAFLSVAKYARMGYSHSARDAALELIVEHMGTTNE